MACTWIVQGEGHQLRWRTDAEAGCESAKICSEGELTLVIRTKPVITDWVEGEVDGLELRRLVDARERT